MVTDILYKFLCDLMPSFDIKDNNFVGSFWKDSMFLLLKSTMVFCSCESFIFNLVLITVFFCGKNSYKSCFLFV